MSTSTDHFKIFVKNSLKKAAKAPVHIYRWFISPLFVSQCRFHPSCSSYAIEAIDKYGPIKGWGLSVWRMVRCGPWSKGGHDPVPASKEN